MLTRGPQHGADSSDHGPQGSMVRNNDRRLRPLHQSEINRRVKLDVCFEAHRQIADTLTIAIQVITQFLCVHEQQKNSE